MTAGPLPRAPRASDPRRTNTGWSLGQGLAALVVAVGAVLTAAWNDAGDGAFGIAVTGAGVVALGIVETVRVRRRVEEQRRDTSVPGDD